MVNNKPPDPKTEILHKQGALNPRPQKISDPLFIQSDFFDTRDLVQVKYEMLRRVQTDGYAIRKASSGFGFSRPSFYQAQSAFEREGLPGLLPKKRGPRSKHKLTAEVLKVIQHESAEEASVHAQALKAALQIKKQFNLVLHPRTIERALIGLKKKRRVSSSNRSRGTTH